MSTWKTLERRVCRALGGERRGPIGRDMSDCVGVPYAVEVKRSSRPGPPVLSKWILQARESGRKEGLPWIVVVAGHNDRRPIACLDFAEFVALRARATGSPPPAPPPTVGIGSPETRGRHPQLDAQNWLSDAALKERADRGEPVGPQALKAATERLERFHRERNNQGAA